MKIEAPNNPGSDMSSSDKKNFRELNEKYFGQEILSELPARITSPEILDRAFTQATIANIEKYINTLSVENSTELIVRTELEQILELAREKLEFETFIFEQAQIGIKPRKILESLREGDEWKKGTPYQKMIYECHLAITPKSSEDADAIIATIYLLSSLEEKMDYLEEGFIARHPTDALLLHTYFQTRDKENRTN